MGYAIVRKAVLNPAGTNVQTQATGNFLFWASLRPCQLVGFGAICTVAGVTKTTDPVIKLQRGPYAAGGVTFADLANWSMTLTLAAPAQGLNLGDVTEIGAMLKYIDQRTGKAPVSPLKYLDPIDLGAGDVVAVNLLTQASYVTQPVVAFYLLYAPQGTV